jgi:thiamine kinase-like enzyme
MDLVKQIKSFFNGRSVFAESEFLSGLSQLHNVEELGKGLANINYLLDFGDTKLVMRFNIWQDQVWYSGNEISIENEHHVLKFIEPYEVGPKVYFVDSSRSYFPFAFLIEEYIEHDNKSVAEDFKGVVNVVKRLHEVNIKGGERFLRKDADADSKIKLYDNWLALILQNNQSKLTSLFSQHADTYKGYLLENTELLTGNTLIHRDLFPENFLHVENKWLMIDWQTAAIGNPIQDIAYLLWDFIYQYNLERPLTDSERKNIITSYYGEQSNSEEILSKVSRLLPIFYVDLFMWLLYKAASFQKQEFTPELKEFLWSRIKTANDIILKEDQIKLWFSKMK